jgi:DNA-directed RNA polymerase specialized sigma24 family protein
MEAILSPKRTSAMTAERDQRLSEAIEREQPRLRNFIRKRVADVGDAEDILQEIF